MTFMGLSEDDFGDLKGSSWRQRDSLAGELAKRLKDFVGRDCQSWGVRRRLELHLARKADYDFDDPLVAPKLFVYTTGDELTFGFYVEGDGSDDYPVWLRFQREANRQSPLRDALVSAITKHSLCVADLYKVDEGGGALARQFRFTKGSLHVSPAGKRPTWKASTFEQLSKEMGRLDGNTWVDLHIFARIDKQAAIQAKRAVIDRIVPVLADLAPVYRECARS